MQLFDVMLAQLKTLGLLKARGRQRTDSTHILAAVRSLNRLERVGETMRHALNTLAEEAPDWLRTHAAPEWYERYGRRMENYRFRHPPRPNVRHWERRSGTMGFNFYKL